MKRYDPKEIEPKWQKIWDDTKLYQVDDADKRPKHYQLEFFPYPSGVSMHVGHVRNYVISDTYGRFMRMTGHNVLHPMGWDAFGLPAENQAIKTGTPPRESTEANIKVFKRQLRQMGLSYDWSREINSSSPDYYRWTQWFFLFFYKKGLAYKAEADVNWCPFDKTVLANEQVIKRDGINICERCENPVEKRSLSQWFFKITDYADRLLNDLDDIDWPENVKTMQRNWIGRSVGAEIVFTVDGNKEEIKVFTTRADTLFGATYMVLAPEHPLVEKITTDEHRKTVEKYVQATKQASEVDRQNTEREKTGAFTGAYATNPANNQKIPVWIADYVLPGYGTGAIMAVPAHDERDYAFAQAHDLPIVPVVAEEFDEQDSPVREGVEFVERQAVQLIVEHPEENKYLLLKRKNWEKSTHPSYVTGGIEDGEDPVEAGLRELMEEAGYKDVASAYLTPYVYRAIFYHEGKKLNRRVTMHTAVVKLASLDQDPISEDEKAINEPFWADADYLIKHIFGQGCKKAFSMYQSGNFVYTGEGILINSGDLNELPSSEAREKMTKKFGKEKVNYKMRDWLISRQRYWGAPIPMVYCPKDGPVPVPEDQLPVVLPDLETYQPSDDGRSPLARDEDWLRVECPKCGGPAERETDTMDTFVDSSWYYMRFADPHNDKAPFDSEKVNKWLPVDNYVGGVEHAVVHLLFSRFWTKVLKDEGMVGFSEPFHTLRNQGMIGGADGRKMGKRYGNVVTPDDIINKGYGADSLRLYELFIGPYNQGVDWSPTGIDGTKRFLNRVWALVQDQLEASSSSDGNTGTEQALEAAISSAVHKAIRKVTIDVQDFAFNTAVAAMMELVNELYKLKTKFPLGHKVWEENLRLLVQILAPFAPHICEELWQVLGGESSVHVSGWPTFDPRLVQEELISVVLQVNGKVRAQIEVDVNATEEEIKRLAHQNENIARHIEDKTIRKTIYVPGKLINFVI